MRWTLGILRLCNHFNANSKSEIIFFEFLNWWFVLLGYVLNIEQQKVWKSRMLNFSVPILGLMEGAGNNNATKSGRSDPRWTCIVPKRAAQFKVYIGLYMIQCTVHFNAQQSTVQYSWLQQAAQSTVTYWHMAYSIYGIQCKGLQSSAGRWSGSWIDSDRVGIVSQALSSFLLQSATMAFLL